MPLLSKILIWKNIYSLVAEIKDEVFVNSEYVITNFLTSLSMTSGDVDVTSCLFVYITLDKGQCRLKSGVNK